ncbi:hypothetical protein HZS_5565 [Henneguya salminicola]|nr:hypothetical protein HZS_5565 [Henneguya salminicola]
MHNIELHVANFEKWCDYNKVHVQSTLDTYSYANYFAQKGLQQDTVVIVEDISSYGYSGYATVGTICSHRSVVLLDFGVRHYYDQLSIAETLVHEIGHNFGFPDVNKYMCKCGFSTDQHCLMQGTHRQRMLNNIL